MSRSMQRPAAPEVPAIYLITGPMAAGKSTVARLLAARFERGVHLEGDIFRRSIVAGRREPTPAMTPEQLEQLRLRYRLAAAAADGYFEAGFTVALEDVVAGPLLGELPSMIRSRPCHLVVLLPSSDAIAAREAARDHRGYGVWGITQLRDAFVGDTPHIGIWLDTSDLTAEETVDAILERTRSHAASSGSEVFVTDYDRRWPRLFERIAEPVRAAVADLGAEVEHVGSTSVPGLRAKPIIDIDVVLCDEADVDQAIERLRALGYTHLGNKGIPGREAFMWPNGAQPHHLYTVVAGTRPHRDHIDFRDHLRTHPDTAHAYADLKDRLAAEHRDDRLGYAEAKDPFIAQVLRDARKPTPPDDTRGDEPGRWHPGEVR